MAGRSDIKAGRAHIEMYVKNKGLIRGLQKAQARLRAFGTGLQSIGIKTLAAGSAITAPLLLATKKFMSMGDEVAKMSIRVGFGVRALSELGFAAEQSGSNLDQLGTGLFRMIRRVANASTGTGPAVRALKELGLVAEDLTQLSPEKQFYAIADALAGVKNESLAAQYAFELFGLGAKQLLPLLREGTAGMDKLRKEARELGRSISPADAQAAAVLADAWNRLISTLKGATFQIGSALASSLEITYDKITEHFKILMKWIKSNRDMIVSLFKFGAGLTAAGAAAVAIGAPFLVLAKIIGVVASVVATLSGAIGAPLILGLGALAIAVTAVAAAWANAKIQGISFGESVLDLTHKITGLDNAYSDLQKTLSKEDTFNKRGRDVEEGLQSGDAERVEAGIEALEARKAALEKKIADLKKKYKDRSWRERGGWRRSRLEDMEKRDVIPVGGGPVLTSFRETMTELKLVTSQINRFKEAQREAELRKIEEHRRAVINKLLSVGPSVISQIMKTGKHVGKAFIDSIAKQFDAIKPLMHKLSETMAQGIADPQKREVALAKLRHKTERAEGPANRAMLEKIQQQEIANIRSRYARQAAEKQQAIDRRSADGKMFLETQIQDDIARLKIENTMKGARKERALLKLRQSIEAREAWKSGVDPKLLAQKHLLEGKLPTAAALGGTAVGTFSAAQSALMGGGGGIQSKILKLAGEQLKKAKELVEIDKNLLREAKRGRLTATA